MGFVLFAVGFVLLFLGLNIYLAWRLGSVLQGLFGYRNRYNVIVYIVIGLLTLMMILGIVTDVPFLALISAVYMGIWINLLLCCLICELVFAIIHLCATERIRHRVRLIHRILTLILPLLLSLYGFLNAAIVKTTEYTVSVDSVREDIKIAMVSDLHLGAVGSESKLERWIEAINEQEPDLVLIAGDLIDSNYNKIADPERAAELLASIESKYGVYACLGNHDAGKTYTDMLAFFERADITVLRDSYRVIDGQCVVIGRCDYSPIGATEGSYRRDTDELLDSLPTFDLPVIVMDHNPTDILSYDSRVDLIVSGHTHKGQIFPANIVTELIYTVDYGMYQHDTALPYVIVSSGIGGWGMPMKTAGHSELVLITLSEK